MYSRNSLIWIVLPFFILVTSSCASQDGSAAISADTLASVQRLVTADADPRPEKPVSTDSSFARYLNFFSDVHKLEDWPEEGVDRIVLENVLWESNQSKLKFVLQNYFHQLDPILYRHIPSRQLNTLARREAQIKNPLSRYDFYAYSKVLIGSNWLVSLFALKRVREESVYHQDAFLLATYSQKGALIDDFIWCKMIDDDLQVYNDIDVANDTLLKGSKANQNDYELSEVYEKVIISPSGKFKSVFSQYPEGYIWN